MKRPLKSSGFSFGRIRIGAADNVPARSDFSAKLPAATTARDPGKS
jgi:hypothetical protein